MNSFLSIMMLCAAFLSIPAFAKVSENSGCEPPVAIAEPWTSWMQSGTVVAGGDSINAPRLMLGKPVTATLRPAGYVHYAVVPGKNAARGHGGLFTLSIKVPARVGIALSDAAWVDVVDGAAVVSTVEHGHGPDCSGIRQIVWFDLKEGVHHVQIAGAPGREIRIMAADAAANRPVLRRENDGF